MKRDVLGSTVGTLERVAPILVTLGIVVLAYFLFIAPRIADTLRSRQDARTAENRVRAMQGVVARGAAEKGPEDPWPMAEFERRTPLRDQTSDIVEELAQIAQSSAASPQMKALTIDTGERVPVEWPSSGAPRAAGNTTIEALDPRFELFHTPLQYTPISVSFASSYRGIGTFLWRVRDLPTTIEIRTLELTRGLPLMTSKLVIFVVQRVGTAPPTAAPGVRASVEPDRGGASRSTGAAGN